MATLKICAVKDTWLTDIEEVTEICFFSTKDPNDPINDIPKTSISIPACISVPLMDEDPESHSEKEVFLKVLRVHRKGIVEAWIVPANQCFLMSDTGSTIDRI